MALPSEEIDRLRQENAHLRTALVSRDVLGQAKGILMERHGIDAEEAFQRLVAMSQSTNIKVRDVAQHVVDLRAGIPTETVVE
ncbi:MAG TPA: ANTAR domain-containing protein [Iamia sp.]|nr:ANTAR domain-containing protein [Iamia sp.]